jgi:uncharacterized protein (TIRG00374 family)
VPPVLRSPKYKVTWKTFVLPIAGLVAFFAYILIFNVDIREIIQNVRHIDLPLYVFAAVFTLLDTLFFTFAWSSLLRRLSVKISVFRSLLFVWVGIFVDTLIPAESVSGEISKIYLVNRDRNGTAGKATATIVAQRLIGMAINIGTLLTGAILLLIESLLFGLILNLILFLIIVTVAFLALIVVLSRKEDWTLRIVDAVIRFVERISRGRWKLTQIRAEVIESAKAFHSAMREYAHAPKSIFVASFFSATSWIFSLLVFYFTFAAIGYPQLSWSAILVISAIFLAVKAIPIGVPFEVGLPEITLTTLLILFGVPPQISATGTIMMRLLTLWLRFFVGFGAQQWLGIKGITTGLNSQPSPATN